MRQEVGVYKLANCTRSAGEHVQLRGTRGVRRRVAVLEWSRPLPGATPLCVTSLREGANATPLYFAAPSGRR